MPALLQEIILQSSLTFLTVSAAAAKSSFPTLVDPVNPIFRTVSDSIRVSPAQVALPQRVTPLPTLPE